jgi:hypothetical protein
VSPVKYELGFHIPEDDVRHSDSYENLKSYKMAFQLFSTKLHLGSFPDSV